MDKEKLYYLSETDVIESKVHQLEFAVERGLKVINPMSAVIMEQADDPEIRRHILNVCDAVILPQKWWKRDICRQEAYWAMLKNKQIFIVMSDNSLYEITLNDLKQELRVSA